MGSILLKLEEDSKRLIEWVWYNNLKANPDKFDLLLSSDYPNLLVNVENYEIFKNNCEKLLRVKFDNKLKFNEHVSGLCKKPSQKLHALARIAHYMSTEKRRMIMKVFINSQFGYFRNFYFLKKPHTGDMHEYKMKHLKEATHRRHARIQDEAP